MPDYDGNPFLCERRRGEFREDDYGRPIGTNRYGDRLEWVSCEEDHCDTCRPDWHSYCDCEDCYDRRNREADSSYTDVGSIWPVGINGYSFKPQPMFYTVGGYFRTRLSGKFGKRETYMGTEIEIEYDQNRSIRNSTRRNRLRKAFDSYSDLTDRLYCKRDGSLDNGVEIVSHPMTVQAWQELRDSGELDFYARLAKAGMVSSENCGMHIHINRSSFMSPSHVARFTALAMRNSREMIQVAHRDEPGYASFDGFQICRTVRQFERDGSCYAPRGAINLQNSATVEVRMFASTLEPEQIIANIEFVGAMQAFTRLPIPTDKGKPVADRLQFRDFAQWLDTQSRNFPSASSMPELDPYRS